MTVLDTRKGLEITTINLVKVDSKISTNKKVEVSVGSVSGHSPESKVEIKAPVYDKLSRRKVRKGEVPSRIAEDLVRNLSGENLTSIARAGYVSIPKDYQKLKEQKSSIDEEQVKDGNTKAELQKRLMEHTLKLRKAKRRSERSNLEGLIASDRRKIRAIDREIARDKKREGKLDVKIGSLEKSIQRKVADKLKSAVRGSLVPRMARPGKRDRTHGDGVSAGESVDLLKEAGIKDLVDRVEPEDKLSRKGSSQRTSAKGFRFPELNVSILRRSPDLGTAVTAAHKYGVPPDIFVGQIYKESLFRRNPGASSAGCLGIAQFAPETARAYGLTVVHNDDGSLNTDPAVSTVFDPKKALPAAAKHMRDLHRMFGNWRQALGGYNAGPGKVKRRENIRQSLIDQGKSIPSHYSDDLPPFLETQTYVAAIMGDYAPKITSSGVLDSHKNSSGSRRLTTEISARSNRTRIRRTHTSH